MAIASTSRERYSFANLVEPMELPDLIAIQRSSFEWFLNEGLRETIDDISPIMDFTGTLAVDFGPYTLGGWQPGEPFENIDAVGRARTVDADDDLSQIGDAAQLARDQPERLGAHLSDVAGQHQGDGILLGEFLELPLEPREVRRA